MADNTPPVSRLEGDALAFVDDAAPVRARSRPSTRTARRTSRSSGTDRGRTARSCINSKAGRRWPDNLLRDPRCSLAVEAGMRWVAIRGEVPVMEDREQACRGHLRAGPRYEGDDPDGLKQRSLEFRTQHRDLLPPPAAVGHGPPRRDDG